MSTQFTAGKPLGDMASVCMPPFAHKNSMQSLLQWPAFFICFGKFCNLLYARCLLCGHPDKIALGINERDLKNDPNRLVKTGESPIASSGNEEKTPVTEQLSSGDWLPAELSS